MSATTFIWPLIQWAVANLFILGLTAGVWYRVRLGSRHLDPLIFGFLFIFVTTALVMLCGLAGVLHPTPIWIASAAGCAVLGGLGRAKVRELLTRLRERREIPRRRLWLDVLLAVALVAVAVRIAVHVWYLPPYVWDTLSYHLPKVAEWVQSHRLVIFETPIDRAFWPANFELFETWFVLFPHHDFLVELACVPFYALACAAVYALARLVGLDRQWGMAAGLIYGLTPAALQHATSGKNDLPIAALFLFALALVVDARGPDPHPRRRLLLIFLVFCLAVGIKPYFVFLAPGLAVAAVWAARGKPWRTLVAGRWPAVWVTGPLLATGLLLAGYWSLRNALVFGNPFYPAEPRVFGTYLFGSDPAGWERQGVILSLDALVKNLRAFFGHKIFDPVYFHFSLRDMTGWGWFAFVCGWPALIYGVITSATVRWLAGIFFLAFVTLLACVVPDPWNMRFAQWFPALFAVGFLLVIRDLRITAVRRGFYVLTLVCLLLNFVGTLDIGGLSPWAWRRMASLPVAERSTAALGMFIGRSYYDALRTIPPGEAIGYNTNYNGWVYPLYDADLSRQVRYVPLDPDTDVVRAMRARGVRYLFVALPPPEARAAISRTVARGGLRQIGEDLYVVAY